MNQDNGASASADRATAAEPKVSALRDGIPSAWLDMSAAPEDGRGILGINERGFVSVIAMAEHPIRTTTKTVRSGPFWAREVVVTKTTETRRYWSIVEVSDDGELYVLTAVRFHPVGFVFLTSLPPRLASGTEARSGETQSGSTEGDGPARKAGDAA